MIEPAEWSEINDSRIQINLQLRTGLVGILMLVISSILNALLPIISFSVDLTLGIWIGFLQDSAGVTAGAFLIAGNIAILKRNGSERAWILFVVYVFGWAWRYAYSYGIFPWLVSLEGVASILALNLVSFSHAYIVIILVVYAWWSIHEVVSNKAIYLSYLSLYAGYPLLSYLVTGILFGFGGIRVRTVEEAFIYNIPSLIISLMTSLVLLLFYLSQIDDERSRSGQSLVSY
ncbi:MAG: hypothetical protein GF309_15695 [Candidatus Lokiarchaeota archaeon]|nr:hypothetical protein [Candidatus Lokiarchaeota archaeon]